MKITIQTLPGGKAGSRDFIDKSNIQPGKQCCMYIKIWTTVCAISLQTSRLRVWDDLYFHENFLYDFTRSCKKSTKNIIKRIRPTNKILSKLKIRQYETLLFFCNFRTSIWLFKDHFVLHLGCFILLLCRYLSEASNISIHC